MHGHCVFFLLSHDANNFYLQSMMASNWVTHYMGFQTCKHHYLVYQSNLTWGRSISYIKKGRFFRRTGRRCQFRYRLVRFWSVPWLSISIESELWLVYELFILYICNIDLLYLNMFIMEIIMKFNIFLKSSQRLSRLHILPSS